MSEVMWELVAEGDFSFDMTELVEAPDPSSGEWGMVVIQRNTAPKPMATLKARGLNPQQYQVQRNKVLRQGIQTFTLSYRDVTDSYADDPEGHPITVYATVVGLVAGHRFSKMDGIEAFEITIVVRRTDLNVDQDEIVDGPDEDALKI